MLLKPCKLLNSQFPIWQYRDSSSSFFLFIYLLLFLVDMHCSVMMDRCTLDWSQACCLSFSLYVKKKKKTVFLSFFLKRWQHCVTTHHVVPKVKKMFLVNIPRLLIIKVICFIPCSAWSVWADALYTNTTYNHLYKLVITQITENYNIYCFPKEATNIKCNIIIFNKMDRKYFLQRSQITIIFCV